MAQLNTSALGFSHLPHYSTHALEFFAKLSAELPTIGVRPDYEHFLAGCLRHAIKFLLPDNGYLFSGEHDYSPAMFELQRLPYPICALEFSAGPELYAPESGLLYAKKRIALCFDPHALPTDLRNGLAHLIESKDLSSLPARCLAVTSIYCVAETWAAAVGVVVVNLDTDTPIPLSDATGPTIAGWEPVQNLASRGRGQKSKHGLPSTFYTFPERARLVGQHPDEALQALYLDTLDEVRVTYEFLAAINCANVGTVTVAAPSKLNAKRARSGKKEFYPYKVLDLASAETYRPGAGGAAGIELRKHLRRGHLRHLGERFGNKVLWINATTVKPGLPGDAKTVYKVRP